MAKVKKTVVGLKCTETGVINYTMYKPKRVGQTANEKLEVMKYCPRLKKHTLHVETKLD